MPIKSVVLFKKLEGNFAINIKHWPERQIDDKDIDIDIEIEI